jgi:molecular chaperone DnaK
MQRETIDFGIDLGTTNSSIAVWGSNGVVDVIKNTQGSQSTPSAIYEGRRGRILVGAEARAQLAIDPANVQAEFKQQMGRPTIYTFPVSGRTMRPEELSADILKTLKGDVQRRLNEDLRAAVITIPAAFEKSEIYATNKAAELAGFITNPLCLEPVAAALAYGHQNASKDGFWMVFDFGGGTFDAAIVQLKDEEFQIVNHHGDNFLGGKLLDWAILDEILIPAVRTEFNRTDFSRKNDDPKIQTAISKLKLATEKAKIDLSTAESCWVEVDNLLSASNDEALDFEFELKRSEVDLLAAPYILRAINLCRKALQEKRLAPQDIERLILVGGPTQMPIFRKMLADPKEGLGIPLEFSVDPMTVVAQGAAIFARTHRLPEKKGKLTVLPGEVAIELKHEPAGADDLPVVAGKLVPGNNESPAGFSIEFRKNDWRSGKIQVTAEGAFMTQLVAERGENIYAVDVVDAIGSARKTIPDQITYLRKALFKEIPLLHNIAVGLADNSVDPLFEKGMPLPLKKTKKYTQAIIVSKDDPKSAIRIPLVEGSNPRADRNSPIGYLIVSNQEVRRDLPVGSEVEFTLSVDTSNRLTATAYVQYLDQEFEKTSFELERPLVDKDIIKKDAAEELARFAQLEKDTCEINDAKATLVLERIRAERLSEEVDNALAMIDKGGDADDLLLNRLRDLRLNLDDLETALAFPKIIEEARKNREDAEKMVNSSDYADSADKETLTRLCKKHDRALGDPDADQLRQISYDFDDLYFSIAEKDPGHWVARLGWYRSKEDTLTDQAVAKELFAQGERAISNNDLDGLKATIRLLRPLLPKEAPPKSRPESGKSTVEKRMGYEYS